MERAGNSPPQFEFDEGRTYFKVVLPIHPAHLPRARALPLRVGAPALPTELVGRADLIDLLNRKLAQRSVCLLAPRGRGTSSLLRGLAAVTVGDRRHYLDMAPLNQTSFRRYVADILQQRAEGERLVFLLDHVDGEYETLVLPLLESTDVRVVAAPLDLVEDDHPWWWTHFDSVVVPPLSSSEAQSLASRLLAGLGHPRNDALALAIGETSAGIPRLIHLLVDRVHVDPTRAEPGRFAEFFHELIAERGDPSGLRGRVDRLGSQHFDPLAIRALDGAADAPAGGLSPDELRAALVDDEVTPAQARHTMRSLLDEGWLVERDGRISFEHPVLQDHWKLARQRGRSRGHLEDDIPF